MKKNSGSIKWMIVLLVGLVLLSVACTVLVVLHLTSRETAVYPWDEAASEEPAAEIRLENIYITDSDSHTVSFLYEGETYRIRGVLKESYRGVADLCICGDEISKIYVKRSQIDGTLLSYTESAVEVEGYGLLTKSDSMHVFRIGQETPEQIGLSDLVVGEENLTYIVGDGQICAILEKEHTTGDTIRVLIKNGSQTEYEQLFLTGSDEWTINGAAQEAGTPVEMADYVSRMVQDAGTAQAEEVQADAEPVITVSVACPSGFLYLTDRDGTKISEDYEGVFLVRRSAGGVVLVNQLPIEDYVRYVLPSEMEDYFPLEAQKAQAVCARTYAYAQMGSTVYAAYGANLDDSTAFQVYNRFGSTELTDQAVADTSGEIIVCGETPITCYYFSTSPGVTGSLEVWAEESPEYIVPASTLLDGEKQNIYASGALAGQDTFCSYIAESPESYDSSSPYYRWTATLCTGDYEDATYGSIRDLTVTSRSANGYATGLSVTYDSGTVLLTGEFEIRTFLGRFLQLVELSDGTYRDNLSMLPSACFFVEKDGDTYTLPGGGFGHGIGMSQYAAGAMAQAGMDYREIIDFFYENVEIVKK